MIDDETRARMAGMKRAGMPTKAIAARFGLTIGQVSGVVYRAGAFKNLSHKGGKAGRKPSRVPVHVEMRQSDD